MRFIGDVHGHIELYLERIERVDKSFQVGDMGLGFQGVFLPHLDPTNFFIRGNHDSPSECRKHKNYAGDYGYIEADGVFFLGGAYSIDTNMRLAYQKNNPGCKPVYWADEELSIDNLSSAHKLFIAYRPNIVVTHDCPDSAAFPLLDQLRMGGRENKLDTRTGHALERMFQSHQPKVWVFGHYHLAFDLEIEGTRFICLPELSYIDLPT